jgi:hypothetical protein
LTPNPNFSVSTDRYLKAPFKETKFDLHNDVSNGVFSYFRSQCSNQNPNNSEFINVTSSENYSPNYPPSYLLD